MQPPEMAAFHKILRSRTTLLNYPSKFNLILTSLIPNSRRQNPNFRPIHSSTPNSSSLEPLPQNTLKTWSIYATPPVQPPNVVRAVNNDGEEVNLPSNVVDSFAGNERNDLSTPTSSNAPSVLSNYTSPHVQPSSNIPSKIVDSVVSGSLVGKGKKGKSKVHYVCSNCGHSYGQWWGICPKCNQQATMTTFVETESEGSVRRPSWSPYPRTGENEPVKLVDVSRGVNHLEWRVTLSGLFGIEINRVLGGGLVPGSLILVGGDPGVGKSTLALQVAALIAESCDGEGEAGPVIYISGEESVDQIGNRADRLNIDTENLYLYSSTDVQDILENVRRLKPRAVVVDSIQTVYLKGVNGSAGGLSQVKECTSSLLCFAKSTNIPFIVIGHVTKSGEIAGPRVLEHIVDVVLYMEGEKHSSHRLLRSVKNRFGTTDELGVFEMSESGLQAVSNPSEMFLSEEHSESEHLAGLAITVIIDGSRTFLVEVQALCSTGPGITRHFNGVHSSRADMILSVLKKQAGLKLGDHSVYLNVINGVSLTETSGDLAMAAAICSSFLEFPLPNNVAFIGEIGLGGELRMVQRIEKRVNSLAQLGFKKCVVPESAKKLLAAVSSEIQIVSCTNLKQVIDKVFRKDV